jgi:eukaryotic-like serine/threonine-protein kinase
MEGLHAGSGANRVNPQAKPPILAAGTKVAEGYEVVTHLSRGDALDVYEVWSHDRQCSCIAKCVRPDRPEPRVRERLLHEGRLLSTFSHPHLVRAYETIMSPHPVVIFETLRGATLEHLLVTLPRRLPVTDLGYLGMHLCSAIHYIHGHGYLHLDVKPANVISHCGTAKLIDLSLARRPGPAPRGCGTREYLAPEQARGDPLTPATDVWGIGATLYHAATRLAPFEPHDRSEEVAVSEQRAYLQLHRAAPRLRQLRRLPRQFNDTIEQCLNNEPSRRPSVSELYAALERLVSERPNPRVVRAPPTDHIASA